MIGIKRKLHRIDARGKTLGRLSTEIANLLRGKLKTDFSLNIDCGDAVEISNARAIKVTGRKLTDKMYYRHSGYPGSIKSRTLSQMLESKPEEVIRLAVRNMLPDNRLRSGWLKRLTFTNDENS